ncbi:MAG: hypothetical protein Q9226_001593 [Calogaya cf. arnoldii]
MDRKCGNAVFDTHTPIAVEESFRPALIRAIAEGTTKEEHGELRRVHPMTAKKLSDDRKSFFIWHSDDHEPKDTLKSDKLWYAKKKHAKCMPE